MGKKHIYTTTTAILISSFLCIEAQSVRDRNWDSNNPIFFEDFDNPEQTWDGFVSSPNYMIRAFAPERPCGVVFDNTITRPQQCQFFPEESFMEITAQYAGDYIDNIDEVPDGFPCDNVPEDIFYYSGNIEVIPQFRFGYFEIRCKLPIHKGAFPSFWLWGCGPHSYEEIDIFEYSWLMFEDFVPGREIGRKYSVGMWYNPEACENNFSYIFTDNIPQGRLNPLIPEQEPSFDDWNIFSCEWTPNYVRWYLNGNLINAVYGQSKIPQNHLTLKVNYSIDNSALNPNGTPQWTGRDKMDIDYIAVKSLKHDCETEELFINTNELENFEYKVKRRIVFGNGEDQLVFPENFNDTFRATTEIELKGPVVIPAGSKVSFSMSDCE